MITSNSNQQMKNLSALLAKSKERKNLLAEALRHFSGKRILDGGKLFFQILQKCSIVFEKGVEQHTEKAGQR